MSITHRMGCFFLLIGGLIFALFIVSDMARTPEYTALWISLPVVGFGYLLWRKGRPEPRPSGRFRLLAKKRDEKKRTEEKRHGRISP